MRHGAAVAMLALARLAPRRSRLNDIAMVVARRRGDEG